MEQPADLIEEVMSVLWNWSMYCEDDPDEYRSFTEIETQRLQLDLLRCIEMLRLETEPTEES